MLGRKRPAGSSSSVGTNNFFWLYLEWLKFDSQSEDEVEIDEGERACGVGDGPKIMISPSLEDGVVICVEAVEFVEVVDVDAVKFDCLFFTIEQACRLKSWKV